MDLQAYDEVTSPGQWASTGRKTCRTSSRGTSSAGQAFEKLLGGAGISPKDTVVLYGDNNNWFAAYGFWLFKTTGMKNVKLMNGGRQKWLNEQDKPFTTDKPSFPPVAYTAKPPNDALRARLTDVMKISGKTNPNLVDVCGRPRTSFTGKSLRPFRG